MSESPIILSFNSATRVASRILLCTRDAAPYREFIDRCTEAGDEVRIADNLDAATAILKASPSEVCLVDHPDAEVMLPALARDARRESMATQILHVEASDHSALEDAGCDFEWEVVYKPHALSALQRIVMNAVRRARVVAENLQLKRQLDLWRLNGVVARSRGMQSVLESVRAYARDDAPVLIKGEPGTEAAAVARMMHLVGRFGHRDFIQLECAVLSADVLHRELFGRSLGMPASAPSSGEGLCESTHVGTVFLADVDAVALPAQHAIISALRHRGEFRGPGQRSSQPRIVAATTHSLEDHVRTGRFDAELHRQLRACTIEIPPLRERREDIAPLTEQFLAQFAIQEGCPPRRLTIEALELLEKYEWPGNVDELRNVVDRSCSLDLSPRLTAEMVEPWLSGRSLDTPHHAIGMALRDMERKLIETTFARCGGNRERTAQSLNIGLRTLSGKLREYGYPPRGGPGSNREVAQRKAA